MEAAIRYSSIDLRYSDINGGKQDNLTIGLNYYATSNVRFMANYIFFDVKESPAAAGADDSPNILLMRAQFSF